MASEPEDNRDVESKSVSRLCCSSMSGNSVLLLLLAHPLELL